MLSRQRHRKRQLFNSDRMKELVQQFREYFKNAIEYTQSYTGAIECNKVKKMIGNK